MAADNKQPKSSPKRPRPVRRLVVLAILAIAMLGTIGVGTVVSNAKWTPNLALDLEGGTEMVLTPQLVAEGKGSEVSPEDINQAIEVIRKRIDASGVSEAEITSQGGSNIVVGIPGQPSEETLNLVRESAVLRFRPVLSVMSGAAVAPQEALKQLKVDSADKLSDKPTQAPKDTSDPAWITPKLQFEALTLNCAANKKRPADDAKSVLIACSEDSGHAMKYILGPAAVDGSQVKQATSGPRLNQSGTPIGGYEVDLTLDSEGAKAFGDVTTRIYNLPSPRNQFGIVLDGRVISAPVPNGPITGGRASITGNFTALTAKTLANQLAFGSLPINFNVQSEEQISATLGSESLQAGLIAGVIGILAVFLYMLWQYYGIGILAIGSLSLGAVLTYLVITLLSWTMGYRLSLAGVVGIIISIGITADSFIVYFERVRDEIRDGLSVPRSIDLGWKRALRTILVSDMVNFVAAAVLYLLAVGGVRGFAFTLGLTTIVDLIVVIMFTRPIMQLLAKTKFVGGGSRWSGIGYEAMGVSAPTTTAFTHSHASRGKKSATAVSTGMTIAEKKAAEKKAAQEKAQQEAAAAEENAVSNEATENTACDDLAQDTEGGQEK